MKKHFNPKIYLGKNRIQTPTPTSGISKCWTWKEEIKEYICKSFEARKSDNTKRLKAHFDTLEEAKGWLYGVTPQAHQAQTHNCPKFKDVVNHWLENYVPVVRISTQRHYRDLLKGLLWFADKYMDEMTPDLIVAWLTDVKKKKYRTSRHSFRKELKLLRQIFSYYKETFDYCFVCPAHPRHVRLAFIKEAPVKNKELLEADFLKFRAKLETLKDGQLYAALATLQYYCCLRISEAAGVFKQDLKFGDKPEENRGVFRRALKTSGFKGDKAAIGDLKNSNEIQGGYKTLPLHPEIKKYVEPFANSVDSGAIFKIDNEYLSKRKIEYTYYKAFKAAGLEFRGTHVLRHGSISEFFSQHADMGVAKLQLGVKSMKTVEVYIKPLQKNLDKFVHDKWKNLAANGCKPESETKKEEKSDT